MGINKSIEGNFHISTFLKLPPLHGFGKAGVKTPEKGEQKNVTCEPAGGRLWTS